MPCAGIPGDAPSGVGEVRPAHTPLDRDGGAVGIDIDEKPAGLSGKDRRQRGGSRAPYGRHARNHGTSRRGHITGLREPIDNPTPGVGQLGHMLSAQRDRALPCGGRNAIVTATAATAYDDDGIAARQGTRCSGTEHVIADEDEGCSRPHGGGQLLPHGQLDSGRRRKTDDIVEEQGVRGDEQGRRVSLMREGSRPRRIPISEDGVPGDK